MAWVVHSKWLERHFNGTQTVDLDGAGTTINLGIVTESSISADTANLYSGLTAVGTATGWTGPVALASKTCALDGSFDLVFDSADPATIAQDAGGFTTARSLVLYETTSGYIIAHHTEGSAFGNVSGPIDISFPSGIFKITI